MESKDLTSVKPKSNKKWFILGGVVALVVCLCLVAAIVIAPPLLRTFNAFNGGYSGIASEGLLADTMQAIADYELSQNGCADVSLFSGTMLVNKTDDGSWQELWQVNACGASHLYSVSFTPSASGGTDFSITPTDQ